MTDPHEQNGQQVEPRSRVKVTMSATHKPHWEVSVVEGAQHDELDRIRKLAVDQHNALVRELLGGTP